MGCDPSRADARCRPHRPRRYRHRDPRVDPRPAALFKVHRTPDMTEWVAGIDVRAGEQLTYQGVTYEVVQGHRTQAGWEPDKVPSLWKKVA